MGHRGPVLRPRCIRPARAGTQIHYYYFMDVSAGDKIEKNEMGWACGAYE